MLHKRVTTETRSKSENKIWDQKDSALLKAERTNEVFWIYIDIWFAI